MLFNTIAVTLLGMIAIPLIIGTSLKAPKLMALALMGVLFWFSSSSWGQLQVENTIYSRGVGQLSFSLINIVLFVAGSAVLIRKLTDRQYPPLAPQFAPYFAGFAVLLLAHVAVAIVSGIEVLDALAYTGIINILNMLVFTYLAIMAFREEQGRDRLLLAIIALAGARAVFGVIRYVWFGGDSANPYGNFERMDIKILFFDIADNFVASLAAFCAAWLLTAPELRLTFLKRLALYGFLALEIAAITLSFRRAALVGLALMFAFLLFRVSGRKRIQLALIAGAVLATGLTVFFQQRLQYVPRGDNILLSLFYDLLQNRPGSAQPQGRFYELWAAAQSIGDNWLFGLGTWGRFEDSRNLLDYQFGRYDFVHSGFGHIVLKTGLLGLALFLGLLYRFVRFYFRHCNTLSGNARLFADAGFAGFLFWLPTLLIGTPIIEFRTMLLIGLTLALPFIAVGPARPPAVPDLANSPARRHAAA
ncbi:MAG TPA: O-antigen ligase family protein [Paucimonas sp.]|nr:O-antigen ligase family protein [Paucimonas sp.]